VQHGNGSAAEPAVQHDSSTSETESVNTSNQFSPFVEASAVNFSSSREVEQLTARSVKVRLSRGQKCVVLGLCTIWAKQGSVSVYGAILSASTTTYRIYAPTTHALPSIEALGASAEFELQSLDDGLRDLPYIGMRGIWCPADVKGSACSFYVLGHSFERDPRAPRRYRELELTPWRSLFTDLTNTSSPRVLVCGRRSSGLSTFVRCLLNRLNSKHLAQSDPASSSTLLDLDTNLPEFVPPGMISLVHVRRAVFGPPYAHVLPHRTDGQVLQQHFLGDVDMTDLTDRHLSAVYDLLAMEKSHRPKHKGSAFVVVLPKWLNGIDQAAAASLWTKLAPTAIVCLDSRTQSPHLEPWRTLAEHESCRIHHLPPEAYDKLSSVQEHELQMQSYFHQDDNVGDHALWNDTPALASRSNRVTLAYGGDDATIKAIVLLGGHVKLEDTYDALQDSIVAVISFQAEQEMSAHSGDPSTGEMDSFDESGIRRTEEDLPRWQGQNGLHSSLPYSMQDSSCRGLAIVQEIDITNRKISLIGAPGIHLHESQEQGYHVALVVPRATADGRFKIDWAQKELYIRNKGTRQ